MRPLIAALMMIFSTSALSAEGADPSAALAGAMPPPAAEFLLGGAAARVALPPDTNRSPLRQTPRLHLSAPRLVRETSESISDTAFGGLRLYFGEAWDDGDDVFQLGTALTRGQTTAGVSVTYQDDTHDLTRSELYVDYAVNPTLSVGISGLIQDTTNEISDPLARLGVNAELETGNGTYVSGGIADVSGAPPVFGIAIGLRF